MTAVPAWMQADSLTVSIIGARWQVRVGWTVRAEPYEYRTVILAGGWSIGTTEHYWSISVDGIGQNVERARSESLISAIVQVAELARCGGLA